MNYYIWKDVSFYIYVVLAFLSAIVLVFSIRRLIRDEDKEDDENNLSVSFENNSNEALNKDLNLSESNEVNRENELQKQAEDIVFVEDSKREETIFDNLVNNVEFNKESEDKNEKLNENEVNLGIVFLKNINENLSIVRDIDLKIKNLELKFNEFETKFASFDNEIKNVIRSELSEIISELTNKNLEFGDLPQKTTPKYVSKYLSDIVEDFDLLEREVIKKRISAIISDLNKISGE
ncbi:MAG: hypothetical protein N2446_03855 [Elusimicrobiales bacterium]|nr:hypothetical protein [Elusimicrobiales bacterium]